MIFVQILLVWLIIGCFFALIIDARPVLKSKNPILHILAYLQLMILWPLVLVMIVRSLKKEPTRDRYDDSDEK